MRNPPTSHRIIPGGFPIKLKKMDLLDNINGRYHVSISPAR